jgi:hypothetical protein
VGWIVLADIWGSKCGISSNNVRYATPHINSKTSHFGTKSEAVCGNETVV